jgi:hypothetical protein
MRDMLAFVPRDAEHAAIRKLQIELGAALEPFSRAAIA